MSDAARVLVPLISANEPEAQVVAIEVEEGAWVEAGAVIAVIENTKAAVDVEAATAGHVVGLRTGPGEPVTAGDVICWLAPDAGWRPPEPGGPGGAEGRPVIPEGLRISGPALEQAMAAGVDLSTLPIGPVVTRAMVDDAARAMGGGASTAGTAPLRWLHELHPVWTASEVDAGQGGLVVIGPDAVHGAMGARVVVYGGGGHGRQLIDVVRSVAGTEAAAVVDDGLGPGDAVLGVPVLGGAETLERALAEGISVALNAVGGIGSPKTRAAVFDRLADAGFTLAVVVHPTAWIEPSAAVAPGCQVLAGAYVGSAAVVGAGAIVNTSAVISHDCVLGAGANVSPGALLAGGVQVGEMALIGMGVTVNLGATIGAGARVGNGATVKTDVPAGGVVRAGASWPD